MSAQVDVESGLDLFLCREAQICCGLLLEFSELVNDVCCCSNGEQFLRITHCISKIDNLNLFLDRAASVRHSAGLHWEEVLLGQKFKSFLWGPVHTGRGTRKQICTQFACKLFDACELWTLPLTTMCSIICVRLWWSAPRPVWNGPEGLFYTKTFCVDQRLLFLQGQYAGKRKELFSNMR